MIETSILLGKEGGRWPIWAKSKGLAKNKSIACQLHEIAGWKKIEEITADGIYPDLCVEIERVDWPEGESYFPSNPVELWVLGHCLQMN